MRYRVTHRTTYHGRQTVSIGHNQAWLEPRPVPSQHLESFSLTISPEPSIRSRRTDFFGNPVTAFSFNEGYEQLEVTATTLVTVSPPTEHTVSQEQASEPWEQVLLRTRQHADRESREACQFVCASPRVMWCREMQKYARHSFSAGRPILEALHDLTQRIHEDFVYDSRATTVTTPVQEVFRIRRGVCQDFAHLQIALLRSIGLPARYISGYLRTVSAEGAPRLVGADASHAWLSVCCGQAGWVDTDPTNNRFISDDHICLAWGRDYSDVPPLTGVFIGGGQHRLRVEVDVVPLPVAGPSF